MLDTVHFSTYGKTVVRGQQSVLLVHGAGMDQTVWTLQGRYLAFHGWNALALDLPGHGRSRGQPALTSIPDIADWLAEVIASLDQGPAILIGHSMGALACLEAAARHPERVARLCLIGAAPAMPVHPDLLALAEAHDPKAVELILDWAFGPRGHRGANPQPGGWLMGTARSLLLRGDPAVLHGDLAACNAYAGGAAAAKAVRCPTLVLCGSADRMTPAKAGQRLAQAIEGAVCQTIEDSGHMLMVEAPDETREALAGFMRRPA